MSLHGSLPHETNRTSSTAFVFAFVFAFAFAFAFVAACSSSERETSRGGERTKAPLPAGEEQRGEGTASAPPPSSTTPSEAPSLIPSGRCEVDADCTRVEKGCCPVGEYIAILNDQVDAYQASLSCAAVSCPLMMVLDDHSVAQCNDLTHACVVAKPRAIECDAFSPNPHKCPGGWHCRLPRDIADAPGVCVQMCGGFANLPCSTPHDQCVDDPDDDCDPSRGGADCGGICIPGGS